MNVIFLSKNEDFPIKKDNSTFNPRACVGGFIFADEAVKRELCDELGIEYQIKPLSSIEFPEEETPDEP